LATLDGPNTDLEDDAQVVVNCELQPLEPSKSAAGTWLRDVEWTLVKSVDPASHSGYAADSFVSTWTVVATKIDSGRYGFLVDGTIAIHNPAAIAQVFTISDVLSDDTVAAVSCPTYTVPAGGTVDCTFTASPIDDSATLNTVTVTAVGNPAQQASDPIEWTEILTGDDTVTVDDDRNPSGFPTSISGSTTFTYDETFVCSSDQADYTDGFDSDTYPNLATLDGPNTDLEDDAQVVVNCELQPLEPSKSAAGTWQRDVEWTLEKSVSPASHSGYAGESFVSTWTVVATKIDSGRYGFLVEGTVAIYNPAAIAQAFTISDVLNNGTIVAVSCPTNTVPAGGTVNCMFTASQSDDSATLNTVTVSAVGNPAQKASDPIEWTEMLTGQDEGTLSDPRFGTVDLIGDSTTLTFEETFTCSVNIEDYINGFYSFTEVNWGYLNGSINLSASASVTVDCTLVIEYETAYAFGENAVCFIDLGESRWGWVNGPLLPGEYTWPVYAGAGGCDPTAGTYVGDVTVTYDGENVFVEWALFVPNILDSEHIYAGTSQIPPEGFAPGQLEIYSPFDGSPIYIIVHGVVGIPQLP
jgi:hypothetical protein